MPSLLHNPRIFVVRPANTKLSDDDATNIVEKLELLLLANRHRIQDERHILLLPSFLLHSLKKEEKTKYSEKLSPSLLQP